MDEIKKKKVLNVNDLIIAFYLCIPMVTKILATIMPLENNIVILVGVLVLVSILYNKKIVFTKEMLLINIIVIILFLISFFRVIENQYVTIYFLDYILYGFSGIFLVQNHFEYKNVLKYISIIFVFFTIILVYKYIPLVKASENLDFTMDLSYTVLIGIIAMLIYFKYTKKAIFKIISVVTIIINLYYLIVLNNNRGSILALVIFIIISGLQKIKKKKNKVILCIISIVISVFSVNFIFDYIEDMNTDINWVNRLAFQIKQGNISSTRDDLYQDAIQTINNNSLIGIGIGEFEKEHQGQYTHNLFLQLGCENGIIITIMIGGYLILCSYKAIFNNIERERKELLIFLLCQFLPRLFISSVYWLNSFIWIFLYLSIKGEKKKENEIQRNAIED